MTTAASRAPQLVGELPLLGLQLRWTQARLDVSFGPRRSNNIVEDREAGRRKKAPPHPPTPAAETPAQQLCCACFHARTAEDTMGNI